jgi:hypothetical protein
MDFIEIITSPCRRCRELGKASMGLDRYSKEKDRVYILSAAANIAAAQPL